MELSLRRTYESRCNPDEPLDPGDERNVDIDEETTEARGIRWVDALAEKIELSEKPATVFFSGLRGTGKSTELRRLAQRFKDGAPYLDLPVHVLYTVPPAVMLRVNIPVEFLPMIKLFDRKGEKAEAGFSAAREILRKRIPDNHMNEVFGAQNREHRAAQIIQWSGGYPREMIRLLQICVQKPDLDEALFLRLMGMAGDIYRRTVVESAYPVLAKIAVERADLRIFDEGQRELFDVLLQNNIILRYQNDVTWVDVHPAVKDMAGVQDEIKKLEGKLEQERGPASRKGKD
jgi:hypothetical protein